MKSELGVGTSFTFDLGYAISNLTEQNSNELIAKEEDYSSLLSGKRILVAEDNKLNQLFISQLLNKWDAKVTLTNNGIETLEKVKKNKYDLILMDVHMPMMNGLETTKLIRELEGKKSKTPIVACSADVFPESRKQAELAGVDFYITKPVNKKNIREILFLFTK